MALNFLPLAGGGVAYLVTAALCLLLAVRLLVRAAAPMGAAVRALALLALGFLALGVGLALAGVAVVNVWYRR